MKRRNFIKTGAVASGGILLGKFPLNNIYSKSVLNNKYQLMQ